MYVKKDGTIIGVRGKPLKCLSNSNSGYLYCTLRRDGKRRILNVHQLQAYQKYGDVIFNDSIHIRHLNGNPKDNSWDNISIGTQSDNMMDIPKDVRVRSAKKAASYLRRFNVCIIKEIRSKRALGYTLQELADEYNSSKGHMSDIVNRKIYADD